MARVVKTVSLNDETDKALIDKLESVPNISDYIKTLIAEDIKENNSIFTKVQKEEIKKIIFKVLNDENFVKKNNKQVDKEQLDAIDDLFNC
ncbi:MAG: CopG family transcriptional regulator [Clostridium perfringens]|uniref:CopG family transcriptional regulator n=1 Tax=Clostridium perfringens TaxID=1502 RepID=UPI001A1E2E87|nr:CopG family transcriptional regulator [Clostridium perfringens]EHR9039702.1 CopG family transcriptional regulator [Clostridium perfringens]EJT6172495.1 CopG family transcriptional regulator [Clostridium perfringens]EJT6543207.1 CopG family transcriptional regulator [Clostridium perfringens]EJT6568228.1 CopG family transcriptional regulator [Clostridium perfringens]MBS5996123.1 CopG family transcriptional regulator [Clostridium perfringens]